MGSHIDRLAALLAKQGYCKPIAHNKLRLVIDLSRWLERKRIALTRLDEQLVAQFLEARWKRATHRSGYKATMSLLLRHLRQSNLIASRRFRPPDKLLAFLQSL